MGHGSGWMKWSRNEGHWKRRWQGARRLDGKSIIRWVGHMLLMSPKMMAEAIERNTVNLEPKSSVHERGI